MGHNVLITGGAGYIGGSVIAGLLASTQKSIQDARIFTMVKSTEQVQRLSKLGITVIQADASDEQAVMKAVLENEIDMVVHTASSVISSLALNLIRALGRRRSDTGKQVYYVHTSITTLFSEEAGWSFGEVRDTYPIEEQEKQIGGPHPVRLTNILVAEQAEAHNVTYFDVVVPIVYGKGTGEGRQLSVNLPASVRASVKNRVVHKFDKDRSPPATHISDLVDLYVLLIAKVLSGDESVPRNENGHYFAVAHRLRGWDVAQHIVESLHARGLVDEARVQKWPSYEMAAEVLGWPVEFVEAMGASTYVQPNLIELCECVTDISRRDKIVPVNAYRLGWQPKWDEKRCLDGIDGEVQSVLESDTVAPTLFSTLLH